MFKHLHDSTDNPNYLGGPLMITGPIEKLADALEICFD